MKQHLVIKDLAQLSEEELKKLHDSFYPPYFMLQQIEKRIVEPSEGIKKVEVSDDGKLFIYFIQEAKFYPLPSIGQFIEKLGGDRALRIVSRWAYMEITPQKKELIDLLLEEFLK